MITLLSIPYDISIFYATLLLHAQYCSSSNEQIVATSKLIISTSLTISKVIVTVSYLYYLMKIYSPPDNHILSKLLFAARMSNTPIHHEVVPYGHKNKQFQ